MLAETIMELPYRRPPLIVPAGVIIVFVAVAVFLVVVGNIWGWGILAFTGAVTYSLVRDRGPRQLRLSPAGFELITPYMRQFASWNDVSNFRVEVVGIRSTVITDLAPAYVQRQAGIMRFISERLDRKGAIPNVVGHSPTDLASIMNTWRNRYSN